MENIYPKDFFAIEQPAAPVVAIQFRTEITNEDIENSSNWESITFNPSNYFNDLTLEDQGGAQQLTLNLYDKNFAYLENIVVKALFASRSANKLAGEPNYSTDDTSYFEFFISKTSSANLRIRFGYSQYGNDNEYIDESSVSTQTWINRIDSKLTVARTPWLYFQMSSMKPKISQEGLRMEIRAFSITGGFLDKAKMVQKYAKLVGPPQRILEQIGEIINTAAQNSSNNKESVSFEFIGNPPRGYPTPDSEEETIEIMLGSESAVPRYIEEEGVYRTDRLYKSLRQILTEICSKVRPIIYDADGKEIAQSSDSSSDGTGINEDNEQINKVANYNYVIIEREKEVIIQFYYQDPNDQLKNQTYGRTYIWNHDGYSIVKNFDVESKTDFAVLNLQIASIEPSTGEMTLHVASGQQAEGSVGDLEQPDQAVDYTIGNIKDVSDALSNSDFESMFVTNIRDTNSFQTSNERLTAQQAAALLSRKIISNLNNQVFTGTLDIPGDPFYLFDGSIKPFSYIIKIIVRRPNYIDNNGELVEGGVSYVSGNYVIKKISHRVSASGFDTNLEVFKWPRQK